MQEEYWQAQYPLRVFQLPLHHLHPPIHPPLHNNHQQLHLLNPMVLSQHLDTDLLSYPP